MRWVVAELKTKVNDRSVTKFLQSVPEEQRRKGCFALVAMMEKAAGAPARMWGTSIVGFGTYRYRYASGRQAEWFLTGFSPRKKDLTLYILSGFDAYEELVSRLGKHSRGKACLYVKRLEDLHLPTLKKLIQRSVQHLSETNR